MGRRIRRGGEESSFASQIYTCDFLNCENKSLKCESESFRRQLQSKQTNQDIETSLVLQKSRLRDNLSKKKKIIETPRHPQRYQKKSRLRDP